MARNISRLAMIGSGNPNDPYDPQSSADPYFSTTRTPTNYPTPYYDSSQDVTDPFNKYFEQRPLGPEYVPGYDPTTDTLAQEFADRLGGINLDTRGLDKFRSEAMRTGPSTWAQMAEAKQRDEESMARGSGARQAASARGGAMSQLASRGGLTSGARERLSRGGAEDLLNMQQDIGRQGRTNRLQIGMSDEQNRVQQLGMLPGMEIAALQPELQKFSMWSSGRQQDVANKMNEAAARNAFEAKKYAEQMAGYGAERSAQATVEANKGGFLGSWLCTEAGSAISNDEWNHLAALRRYTKQAHPEIADFYFKRCSPLIEAMKKAGADWAANIEFVKKAAAMAKEGKLAEAYIFYHNHTLALIEKYWPECADPAKPKEAI